MSSTAPRHPRPPLADPGGPRLTAFTCTPLQANGPLRPLRALRFSRTDWAGLAGGMGVPRPNSSHRAAKWRGTVPFRAALTFGQWRPDWVAGVVGFELRNLYRSRKLTHTWNQHAWPSLTAERKWGKAERPLVK
jgi:hypothetical protein